MTTWLSSDNIVVCGVGCQLPDVDGTTTTTSMMKPSLIMKIALKCVEKVLNHYDVSA